MVHALIVIGLFFVMLVMPCVVASRIDLDAEEANCAEYIMREQS
jgi:hypothetical protein